MNRNVNRNKSRNSQRESSLNQGWRGSYQSQGKEWNQNRDYETPKNYSSPLDFQSDHSTYRRDYSNDDMSQDFHEGRELGSRRYSNGNNWESRREDADSQQQDWRSVGSGSARSWDLNQRDNWSQSQSSHFGKGPKGYKRSDERIREEICDALTSDHNVDASEIDVEVEDGVVTLKGTVEDRKMKRCAEDCIADLQGVDDVRNEIQVKSSSMSGKSQYSSKGSDKEKQSSDFSKQSQGQGRNRSANNETSASSTH